MTAILASVKTMNGAFFDVSGNRENQTVVDKDGTLSTHPITNSCCISLGSSKGPSDISAHHYHTLDTRTLGGTSSE